MKKFFLIIVCIVLIFKIDAQDIKWGSTAILEESLTNLMRSKSGLHLGNVEDCDYYAYFQYDNSFYVNFDVHFAFIKVKNNETILFTPYTDKSYNYHSVLLIDNQIAIVYSEKENDKSTAVKVDYYSTVDLKFQKSELLFSYIPSETLHKLTRFTVSENKTRFAIFTLVKHPDTDANSFLIKTYDFQLQEQLETYIELDLEGNNALNLFTLNNDGSGYILYSEYKYNGDINTIHKIKVIKFDKKNEKNIEIQEDHLSNTLDMNIVQLNDYQAKLIISEEQSLKIFDLDFKKEDFSEFITYKLKKGNWEIDKLLKLDNGNHFIAIANKGVKRYTNQNHQSIVFYNKSLKFYCFDKEFNFLTYETTLGRYYNLIENYRSPEGYLTVSPCYIQNNNKITLFYNSDMNYPKKLAEDNGDDNNIISLTESKNCHFQKSTIDENGKITTLTLTNSKTEKGLLNTNFCHLNNNQTVTLVKFYKKNITFGTYIP